MLTQVSRIVGFATCTSLMCVGAYKVYTDVKRWHDAARTSEPGA